MTKTLQLFPKAYFNWLRLKWEADPSFPVEPWQVEEYRELSTPTLFDRLQQEGLGLTEENFLLVEKNHRSPEECTHFLWPEKENELPIYLLLFEIWRRLLPHKGSLSILCDELDFRIRLYRNSRLDKEQLTLILEQIQAVLEASTDAGEEPKAAFLSLRRHIAHDLEGFLFDYISDQIEAQSPLEASELLNAFYPYISETCWFDFLKGRLLMGVDSHAGNLLFKTLLSFLSEQPDLDLLLEIAAFLVHYGDPYLFQKACQLCTEQLQTEEEFQELLAIVADYCHSLDKESEEEKIQTIFGQRLRQNLQNQINRHDPDLITLTSFLKSLIPSG